MAFKAMFGGFGLGIALVSAWGREAGGRWSGEFGVLCVGLQVGGVERFVVGKGW